MSKQVVPKIPVESMIHEIRGQRVILDSDLASIYGVETRVLLQQVRRNPEKFPADFLYLLTNKELMGLRSQIVISKGRGGRRTPPMAFTEYGAIMAATVLNSPGAV
ncbi:MAG TPA: ORF6N domain-containing protein, partial [Burkholderiaceae bacterium]|nr:ORF6N domain-containing protein [Burkholderiaceae bacterium]